MELRKWSNIHIYNLKAVLKMCHWGRIVVGWYDYCVKVHRYVQGGQEGIITNSIFEITTFYTNYFTQTLN